MRVEDNDGFLASVTPESFAEVWGFVPSNMALRHYNLFRKEAIR